MQQGEIDTSELPATRGEAKRLGYKHYFTGKPCRYGHVDVRFTVNKTCWSCLQDQARSWKGKNRYHLRAYAKSYAENNRGKRCAAESRRKQATLQSVPLWADDKHIVDIYEVAQQLSEQTGIEMHVDHVVPLRGKDVCGLHCPDNLWIIPADVNIGHKNRAKPGTDEIYRLEFKGYASPAGLVEADDEASDQCRQVASAEPAGLIRAGWGSPGALCTYRRCE